MKRIVFLLLSVFLLFLLLTGSGCSSKQESEGFAIYLTKNDVPVAEMEKLSHVDLADEPVVSIDDIISYNRETHEIELTAEAYERVMNLEVPTSGKSFVVCVDKAPVYWGAFWTPISSQSFDGVTIWVFPYSQKGNIITLQLGYPSQSFYQGEDPRSNPVIMQSLEKAGKLK
jgi:hypothetical protein